MSVNSNLPPASPAPPTASQAPSAASQGSPTVSQAPPAASQPSPTVSQAPPTVSQGSPSVLQPQTWRLNARQTFRKGRQPLRNYKPSVTTANLPSQLQTLRAAPQTFRVLPIGEWLSSRCCKKAAGGHSWPCCCRLPRRRRCWRPPMNCQVRFSFSERGCPVGARQPFPKHNPPKRNQRLKLRQKLQPLGRG